MTARLLVLGIVLVCVLAIAGQLAKAGVPPVPQQDHDPVFSPDGKALAFVRWTGSIRWGRVYVVGANGRGLRALTPSQPAPSGITWAPDGNALAYVADGAIWRVDADGRHLRRLVDGTCCGPTNMNPRWSPDGTEIVFSHELGFRTYLLSFVAPDGGARRDTTVYAKLASWSPDSTRLVTDDGGLIGRDGATLGRTPGRYWSRTGDTLLYRAGFGGIRLTAADGSFDRLVVNPHDVVDVVRWSRDNRRIAFGIGSWLAVTDMSGHWRRLARANVPVDAPSWAPNGTIAYVERNSCGIDTILADRTHRRRVTNVC